MVSATSHSQQELSVMPPHNVAATVQPKDIFKQCLTDNPVRIFNSVLYSILITCTVSGAQSFTESIFIPLIVGFPEDSVQYCMSSALLNALGKHPDFQKLIFFVCIWLWEGRGQIREMKIFRPQTKKKFWLSTFRKKKFKKTIFQIML